MQTRCVYGTSKSLIWNKYINYITGINTKYNFLANIISIKLLTSSAVLKFLYYTLIVFINYYTCYIIFKTIVLSVQVKR